MNIFIKEICWYPKDVDVSRTMLIYYLSVQTKEEFLSYSDG